LQCTVTSSRSLVSWLFCVKKQTDLYGLQYNHWTWCSRNTEFNGLCQDILLSLVPNFTEYASQRHWRILYLSCFIPLLFMTSSQLKVGPPHFKKRPYFFHLQCLFPFQVLIYSGLSTEAILFMCCCEKRMHDCNLTCGGN